MVLRNALPLMLRDVLPLMLRDILRLRGPMMTCGKRRSESVRKAMVIALLASHRYCRVGRRDEQPRSNYQVRGLTALGSGSQALARKARVEGSSVPIALAQPQPTQLPPHRPVNPESKHVARFWAKHVAGVASTVAGRVPQARARHPNHAPSHKMQKTRLPGVLRNTGR